MIFVNNHPASKCCICDCSWKSSCLIYMSRNLNMYFSTLVASCSWLSLCEKSNLPWWSHIHGTWSVLPHNLCIVLRACCRNCRTKIPLVVHIVHRVTWIVAMFHLWRQSESCMRTLMQGRHVCLLALTNGFGQMVFWEFAWHNVRAWACWFGLCRFWLVPICLLLLLWLLTSVLLLVLHKVPWWLRSASYDSVKEPENRSIWCLMKTVVCSILEFLIRSAWWCNTCRTLKKTLNAHRQTVDCTCSFFSYEHCFSVCKLVS